MAVNAVEFVGTHLQIEGAIRCFQDLSSALNMSKRKAIMARQEASQGD